MVVKPGDFSRDFTFGAVEYTRPGSVEDKEQGIDAWLGGIPFAWRRRRRTLEMDKDISVRYSRPSGARTEYHKLLGGDFKAQFFVFQFEDAVLICATEAVVRCLRSGQFSTRPNKDSTVAAYIKIVDLTYVMVKNGVPKWQT